MHHFFEIVAAILDFFCSLTPSGKTGREASQLEKAQKVVLLTIFGSMAVIVGIVWIAS